VTLARENCIGMADMCIRHRSSRGVAVIDIHGRLRLDTAPLLRTSVSTTLARGHRRLVLNVVDVTALDAAGLGEIVRAHTLAHDLNGLMKLVSHRPAVQELLIRTRLLTELDVYDSVSAAVASF
jgi:anti-sigma B factor antagonist